MLYRSSTDSVQDCWPKIVGYEDHLSGLKLSSHYQMIWRGSIRRLKMPLERKSLLAMANAADYTAKFRLKEYGDIFDTCKHLRAKRLRHTASDPWALAAHLGVLLAAARADSVIIEWIYSNLHTVAHMAEEWAETFEWIEQLEKLFDSTLPDALNEHAEGFLRGFKDSDAVFFAERLAGNCMCSAEGESGQLVEGFRLTQEKVLAVCRRWIVREKCKFVRDKSGDFTTQLNAVLSKHPATFFAKHAVRLCTRNNTLMWEEARHAHMVVFNEKQRRIAGMALIYVEQIAELHASKKSLIIRAINPTDDMLATHTRSSIVDAFFDVAIQIAKDNSLAAVAFPCHNGSHLLSNHPVIEKDIEKRYIKPSIRMSFLQHDDDKAEYRTKPRQVSAEFFAYESGNEKVNDVYAIWSASSEEEIQTANAETSIANLGSTWNSEIILRLAV